MPMERKKNCKKFNEIQMNKQTNRNANERNHKTDANETRAK